MRNEKKTPMYGEVKSVERLTPTMIRVVLHNGELSNFAGTDATDAYINARFIPAHSPVQVPFGPHDLDGVLPEHRPRPRRFTIRRWDSERQELTIDFVAHGDVGFAGAWAQRTRPGDRLQFEGPGGSYRPSRDVDWHLFVGDESAFPAIAASIEALPPDAIAKALVVVDGPEDKLELDAQADVSVTWLYRNSSATPEMLLPGAVAAAEFPDGTFDVFVHGEAGEVRAVRKHLLIERGVEDSTASISPYWRRTFTDEAWREVKRGWMAEQSQDAA